MPLIPQGLMQGAGPGPGGPPIDPAMIAQLAQSIGGGAGPGGPPPPDAGPPPPDQGGGQTDVLGELQDWLNMTHDLVTKLPDPKHTKIMLACEQQGATIQSDLMGTQQQASTVGQQLAQKLGGGAAY